MKRQLFIFLLFFFTASWIDLKPLDLNAMKGSSITISVKGAVEQPGQLELPLYSTVSDALARISLSENADTSSLNPNTILKDADVLTIPSQKSEAEIRISINTGSAEELCTLEGIGETTAQNIVDYRNTYGLFQTLEDLMNVKGIGEAKFEKIRDDITL